MSKNNRSVSLSLLSCGKVGKAQIFRPVCESSEEVRILAKIAIGSGVEASQHLPARQKLALVVSTDEASISSRSNVTSIATRRSKMLLIRIRFCIQIVLVASLAIPVPHAFARNDNLSIGDQPGWFPIRPMNSCHLSRSARWSLSHQRSPRHAHSSNVRAVPLCHTGERSRDPLWNCSWPRWLSMAGAAAHHPQARMAGLDTAVQNY